jgi:hypothetical protein
MRGSRDKGTVSMNGKRIAVLILALVLLAGCGVPSGGRVIGGQPIQISELATFPGAQELKPGQSTVIDPLFKAAQDEPPPFIGLGIEVAKSYRTFRLPQGTTFADIKSFYADKLQSAGWREDGAMRVFTTQANASNPNLQGGLWVRIDQTLLAVLATDPGSGSKELMLSLATH